MSHQLFLPRRTKQGQFLPSLFSRLVNSVRVAQMIFVRISFLNILLHIWHWTSLLAVCTSLTWRLNLGPLMCLSHSWQYTLPAPAPAPAPSSW